MTWSAAPGWFFAAYALLTGVYLVLENRRPQATLAWMLLFLALPGIGLVIYALFGRDRKAFSRQSKLLRQNLQETAAPLLEQLLAHQDAGRSAGLRHKALSGTGSCHWCGITPTPRSRRGIELQSSRTPLCTILV
jgi:uncharacterized membrane protein YeiB